MVVRSSSRCGLYDSSVCVAMFRATRAPASVRGASPDVGTIEICYGCFCVHLDSRWNYRCAPSVVRRAQVPPRRIAGNSSPKCLI
jgi:hypothetical protein